MFKKSLLVIFFSALVLSCEQSLPPSIIILTGANNQKHFYTGGINRVFYKLEEKFPADNAIKEISSKLEAGGWEAMSEDFLHPGTSNSLITGWSIYEDPPKKPEFMIYEWSTNWKDKQDNIVSYSFQYKDPIEKFRHGTVILKPSNSSLNVHAVYMPEKVAQSMRESINRKRPNP